MQVVVALSALFPSHWQLQDVFCMRLHDVFLSAKSSSGEHLTHAENDHDHSHHAQKNHEQTNHEHKKFDPISHDHSSHEDHPQCHFCSLYQQTSSTEFYFPLRFVHHFDEPIFYYLSPLTIIPLFLIPQKQAPPIYLV